MKSEPSTSGGGGGNSSTPLVATAAVAPAPKVPSSDGRSKQSKRPAEVRSLCIYNNIFFAGTPSAKSEALIDDCYPLLACRNERDGSFQSVHGQASVPDDKDGGGRTSF